MLQNQIFQLFVPDLLLYFKVSDIVLETS